MWRASSESPGQDWELDDRPKARVENQTLAQGFAYLKARLRGAPRGVARRLQPLRTCGPNGTLPQHRQHRSAIMNNLCRLPRVLQNGDSMQRVQSRPET